MSEKEWDKIQPGDILVTPMTSAVWTPLFGLIKGAVTDSGGALTHPVIVSREYGIPCVAGTLFATMRIKTGDRIRVDGNLGRVYKLS
jgi:phosphoenolpyruvate synthase/pyruvate phosphate dikinase